MIMVMRYVDCGHELRDMVIILTTLVVEISACGHEIGYGHHFDYVGRGIRACGHESGTILAHFGVQGMSFLRSVLAFFRILLL